jgi:hypothetical protein
MEQVPMRCIAFRFVVFLASMMLACGSPAVLIADDAGDFDARVRKWNEWRDRIWAWPVGTSSTYADESPEDYNWRLMKVVGEDHYCLEVDYRQGIQKARARLIRNPRYYAELGLGLDDRWVLTALSRRGEPKFLTSLEDGDSMNYFRRWVTRSYYRTRLVKNRHDFDVAATRHGEAVAFTLSPKQKSPTDGATETEKLFGVYSRIVLWFDPSHASPFRFDQIRFNAENQEIVTSYILDEWDEVKGVSVPKRVRSYDPNGFSAESEPSAVQMFDYTTIDTPVSARECYLSYYGIPEPEGTGGIDSFYIVMAGIGLVLCGVGVYYWRRAP